LRFTPHVSLGELLSPDGFIALAFVSALAAFAPGCSKGEGPARSEAAAVNHAIEALRAADNARKAELLSALRAVPCSVADICAVQSFCAAAYEEHVKVLELIEAAKAAAPTAPADTLRDAVATAQAGLLRAKAQTDQCATKQGELARRYRVAR
jgi:hypothetical protein